jgi:hypothetical protein
MGGRELARRSVQAALVLRLVLLGWRASLGGTKARGPMPSTSDQPRYVLSQWQCGHNGSSSPNTVWRVEAQGKRWSIWTKLCPQAWLEHDGACHSKATRCAAVGPRPRCVTLATPTPFVSTSFNTDSPKRSRATPTGMGPSPVISHSSPSSTWPRTRAERSRRIKARYRGLGRDRLRLRRFDRRALVASARRRCARFVAAGLASLVALASGVRAREASPRSLRSAADRLP